MNCISIKNWQQIDIDSNIYKNIFKIQLSCSIRKAELGAHNMIWSLATGTASRGSPTSGQNCADYLCETLSQPVTSIHTPKPLKKKIEEKEHSCA